MASIRPTAAHSTFSAFRSSLRPQFQSHGGQLGAGQQTRNATRALPAAKKKKKLSPTFKIYPLKDAEQFALCDAMRFIRAFEVGRDPLAYKYELHVKLKTVRNGPVIRNRIKLPNAVKSAGRVAVIVDPASKEGIAAKRAGADLVGEEEIFEAVKAGKIEFDRCLCHTGSVAKLNAAQLGRILGPRGLMPSVKLETIADNVAKKVDAMKGSSEYRERDGVVRMAIGQLAFTPDQLSKNIKTFMDALKADIVALSDTFTKSIHEVVLSSTNAPGFTLNGQYHQLDLKASPEATGPPLLPRVDWAPFQPAR